MIYVGLTDDLARRKAEHGNPSDWRATEKFSSEDRARGWEKEQLAKPGITGGAGGAGWHYGYWYTINRSTAE